MQLQAYKVVQANFISNRSIKSCYSFIYGVGHFNRAVFAPQGQGCGRYFEAENTRLSPVQPVPVEHYCTLPLHLIRRGIEIGPVRWLVAT